MGEGGGGGAGRGSREDTIVHCYFSWYLFNTMLGLSDFNHNVCKSRGKRLRPLTQIVMIQCDVPFEQRTQLLIVWMGSYSSF